MSVTRRLLRRVNWMWAGILSPWHYLWYLLCSLPSVYLWCWVLRGPEPLTTALRWPALGVAGFGVALQVCGLVLPHLMRKSGINRYCIGTFWSHTLGISGAAALLAGVVWRRPDLGYAAWFVLSTLARLPKVVSTRDTLCLPTWFLQAFWLTLIFCGHGWTALAVYPLTFVTALFARRGPLWVIRNRPLYEEALRETRDDLSRCKGFDGWEPLGRLMEMEQWNELQQAREMPDLEGRKWFTPARRARIHLGLRQPKKALAALHRERSDDSDSLHQIQVEAHLQLDDETAAERILRGPRPRIRMSALGFRADKEAFYAWGLLLRHRGDLMRALYFFEQPFAGPLLFREQFMAAVELLLKFGLPGEAAVTLERMVEQVRWLKAEDVELLADCYRAAGRRDKAASIEREVRSRVS